MDMESLAVAGDANLVSAWSALGRHAGFTVGDIDSLTLTASGLPSAYFNGAFAQGRCLDPERAVTEAIAFYAAIGVPFLLWVRAGLDDDLLEAGRAAGLSDAGGPPSMALSSIGTVPPPPAELDLVIASTTDGLQAHRSLLASGFDMPTEVADRVIGDGLLDDPDIAVAVGRVGGRAVTTAVLARSGATAGVYNVATLPDERSKGYGEAATWMVIAEGARRGCTHSVLQSSDVGHSVYLRMGFVDVGNYVQLEGPPAT